MNDASDDVPEMHADSERERGFSFIDPLIAPSREFAKQSTGAIECIRRIVRTLPGKAEDGHGPVAQTCSHDAIRWFGIERGEIRDGCNSSGPFPAEVSECRSAQRARPGLACETGSARSHNERAAIARHVREIDRLARDLAYLDGEIAKDTVDAADVQRLLTIAASIPWSQPASLRPSVTSPAFATRRRRETVQKNLALGERLGRKARCQKDSKIGRRRRASKARSTPLMPFGMTMLRR